jgi:hypothetical protein
MRIPQCDHFERKRSGATCELLAEFVGEPLAAQAGTMFVIAPICSAEDVYCMKPDRRPAPNQSNRTTLC